MRRRFRYVLVMALVVVALTVVVVQRIQPAFRAAATLSVEEPIIESGVDNAAVRRYAEGRVATRHADVVARLDVDAVLAGYASFAGTQGAVTPAIRAAGLRNRSSARVSSVSLVGATSQDPNLVSIIFSVSVEDSDRRVAAVTLNALLALYMEAGVDAETSSAAQELAALDDVVDQRSSAVRRLETTIANFRRENESLLADTLGEDARATVLAETELTQLELQIQRLQDRSAAVDDTLRGLDPRGVLRREVNEPGPATSERLVALQTVLAMLSGRLGSGHPEAQRLDAEAMAVQSELEREADQSIQELRSAESEYDRLQELHPLDYPDVVRMANTVSSLEGVIERASAIGLSNGEIRNIESLAREEQTIGAQLSELQQTRDAARLQVADLRSRTARAPLLEQQYQTLSDNLTSAEAAHSAAMADRSALENEYRFLVQRNSPPMLISVPPYVPESVVATRTSTILAIGVLLGVLGIAVGVGVVERVDRRVLGAQSIAAIHGSLPLAEIPVIPESSLSQARAV